MSERQTCTLYYVLINLKVYGWTHAISRQRTEQVLIELDISAIKDYVIIIIIIINNRV